MFFILIAFFLSSLCANQHEAIFTHTYDDAVWEINEGEKECSSPGSDPYRSEKYLFFLATFLKTHNIKKVIDAGYGDWTSSKYLDWTGIDYTGIDIVKSVIEHNQAHYATENIQFIHSDIFEDPLPEGDLLICEGVLQHLSNADIPHFLTKISKFSHCLLINDTDSSTYTSDNRDIKTGDWPRLDLTKAPFYCSGSKLFTYRSGHKVKEVFYFCPTLKQPSIFLTFLVRNKAHTLPYFLKCIENLDYDKNQIGIYINSNDNCDRTIDILLKWAKKHHETYRFITIDLHKSKSPLPTAPHEWNPDRFSLLGKVRNESLKKALDSHLDYYFVVDCDNFITPCTLKELIKQDKPIIAPLLTSIPEKGDPYSNFFGAIDPNGYYAHHPQYFPILRRTEVGTFKVPLVHCTYLIKRSFLEKLSYVDGSRDYEFIIFSKIARKEGIDQFICNEREFGHLLHFYDNPTLKEERERVDTFFKQHPLEELISFE
ncbi:MAG: glycosyltransferase family 2 protein [Chlamydiia bacterium]|nr:glycosyltransferase family 2 protein [Chlamydiia bacterium]